MNGWFLAAGAICATVPFIIHLLNRRRYKVVNWAAMDFLRQALQRNRRIMQIRDLLLLALRTLAVLLFGLALAQPFWQQQTRDEFSPGNRQPLHAVMIVDNSMSMAYEPAAGENLLSRAKTRASKFVDELPAGSRVSVVPLCGASGAYSLDPYRSAADANNAIEQIEVVDATTNINAVHRLAQEAADMESNLAKRVVFLSDQQRANWNQRLDAEQLKQFPEMQVVDVAGTTEPENSWISHFQMQDEIADLDTPMNFTVRLRHSGTSPRDDVPISLWVDGEEVTPGKVNLGTGSGETEVTFQHTFRQSINLLEPGEMRFVPVKVTLAADDRDRLTLDNERYLVVPVVAALPVVFIDNVAPEDENRSLNRFGESWQLRRWLAPITDRHSTARQLVRIVHLTIDDVNEEVLSDARLVVVAGIEDPADKVELLREYVQQGGQLVIAAGGDFSPSAWNDAAWQGGQGILPVPLDGDMLGQIPGTDGAAFEWFELKYDAGKSLFKLVDESDADLAALYSEPFFFQAVRVADMEATRSSLLESETERLREELETIAAARQRMRQYNDNQGREVITPEEQAQRDADEQLLNDLRPDWLKWASEENEDVSPESAAEIARSEMPRELAAFDNGHPFLIRRQIGDGTVVFATSGIKPQWNTLAQTNAMLLFDRLLRDMLKNTIEERTKPTGEVIAFPIEGNTSNLEFELQRPPAGGELPEPESLNVGFIGARTRGLTISNPLHQGIYTITAYKVPSSADGRAPREVAWQTPLAVNIDNSDQISESDLEPLTKLDFEERLAGEELPITWVGATDNISLDGATIRGQNLWMWLAFVVLLLLLVEISVLAWPSVKAATEAGTESNSAPSPAATGATAS